jgi:hypothetical protein
MAFRLVVFTLFILLFTQCTQNKKQEILPLANYMQQIQMDYAAIANAIKASKIDAIGFHINNIEQTISKIGAHHNTNAKLVMPFNNQAQVFLNNPLNNLASAADANNINELKIKFNELTTNCQNCHKANNVNPAFAPLNF